MGLLDRLCACGVLCCVAEKWRCGEGLTCLRANLRANLLRANLRANLRLTLADLRANLRANHWADLRANLSAGAQRVVRRGAV